MGITVTDIAKRAKVSRSTAGWVLSGRADEFRISQATRQRVLRISQELNYRPSFAAKSLAQGKTFTLGFQYGNIQSPYYTELAEIAMVEAEKRGYHLLIQASPWNSDKSDSECLESLLRRGVDGVVMFGTSLLPGVPLYDELVARRFPIIMVGSMPADLPWIACDYTGGMRQAAEHFKAKGFRSAWYVGEDPVRTNDQKIRAFETACNEFGLTPQIFTLPLDGRSRSDSFRHLGHEFAQRVGRRSAVITESDQAAIGFMRGLLDCNISVPNEVSLVGIDGTDICEFLRPQLATIAYDKHATMTHAIDALMARIGDASAPLEGKLVPTTLIVRESL